MWIEFGQKDKIKFYIFANGLADKTESGCSFLVPTVCL